MATVKANEVAAILTSIAAYGGQLAAVFHSHALIAEKIPCGFEGAINILDATVAVLKQVLGLVKDEADGKKLFSEEGLLYVLILAKESAKTLAKVEPIVANACLERKDRKAKLKESRKASSLRLNVVKEFNPLFLSLDEKEFLDKVEKAKWSWAADEVEECMERLYDLQLHLLLIFEVVTVSELSKDLTSGKVDIQSIVTYHERINRTADLVGIKAPKGRLAYQRASYFSSSDSDSSSDSNSESSTFVCKGKNKASTTFTCGPPPPPGARPPTGPPPTAALHVPGMPMFPPKKGYPEAIIIKDTSASDAKPPAYSEAKVGENRNPSAVTGSCLAVPTLTISKGAGPDAKEAQPKTYSDEKAALKARESKDYSPIIEEIAKPSQEGRLFKSRPNSLAFKLKSFFRSKESLAAEMKRILIDSESHLMAYVVQRHELRQIPHSAFHALEATHMKTILSQLNGNEWYKTFSKLDTYEHSSIYRLLHPLAKGKVYERELVVLKVLEQNRFNAWMAVLGELLRNRPFSYLVNGRVLLAIVREKYIDGKPLKELNVCRYGPPPPPPGFPASVIPSIRPPPTPYTPPKRTTISDLKVPTPPPSNLPLARTLGGPPPLPQGPPPAASSFSTTNPPPPPGKSNSPRLSDITPVTEYEATIALTTYNEYTLRLCESSDPTVPHSWSRATVTQESTDRAQILQRVQAFQRNHGNVAIIEMKLRLSDPQSAQVTRLMDDLKCAERDSRFEWTWVEISLHSNIAEITDSVLKGSGNSATVMHLIAKRSLKPSYNALNVYNALMKPPPPPRPPVSSPIITITPSPLAKKKSKYADSSSDSDSDSSCWSSDSSVGHVRRRLRKYRAKKMRKSDKGRSHFVDSDSDRYSDEEDDDVIAIRLKLKRGDDVVKALLDMWTSEGKGKGKAVA